MIEFRSVYIEGFGSIQNPLEYSFNTKGVTILQGGNGSGKTTIMQAVVWCLYKVMLKEGLTMADVPTKSSLRGKNWRGTRVMVHFSDDKYSYLLARHLNYSGKTIGMQGNSSLMLFKKKNTVQGEFGVHDLQNGEKDIADTEKQIIRIIGLTPKGFLNSVLFGQKMKRLIESDAKDKRALFEELFEMGFIEKARLNAKKEYEKIASEIAEIKLRIESRDTAIKSMNQTIKEIKKSYMEFERNKYQNVTRKEKEIKIETKLIKSIHTRIAKLEQIAVNYDEKLIEKLLTNKDNIAKKRSDVILILAEARRNHIQCNTDIETTKSVIRLLNDDLLNLDLVCPTCNQPLKKEDIQKTENNIKEEISKQENAIADLAKKELEYSLKISELEALEKQFDIDYEISIKEYNDTIFSMKDFKAAATELAVKHNELQVRENTLKKYTREYEKAKKQKPPADRVIQVKGKIAKHENENEKDNLQIESLKQRQSKINWWITKGFASNGVKSFVFKSMLSNLNKHCSVYAELLGNKIKFGVDTDKVSRPFTVFCYNRGQLVNYSTLSGGESQRVNVIVAFGMHDLIKSTTDINILILDEVFEGLDEESTQAIHEVINMKTKQGKAIHIITHSEYADIDFSKRVALKYDNNLNSTVIVS